MSTPAQIDANRANAQKSTGPRTPEGKARSALNNLRDGFRSQSILLPFDDPAEYEALLADLEAHFPARDLTEQRAVREMAGAEWRLRRARRLIEAAYWKEFQSVQTQFPDLDETRLDLRAFENLHLPASSYPRLIAYEAGFERRYDHAYRTWTQCRKDCNRARSQHLRDQVHAVLGAPFPRIHRGRSACASGAESGTVTPNPPVEANPPLPQPPSRTDEPNPAPPLDLLRGRSACAPGAEIVTLPPNPPFEANFSPLQAPSRTDEPNPAPVGPDCPFPPPSVDPHLPPACLPGPSGASSQSNIARNAPCPCRSGLKFKRCCGRGAPPLLVSAVRAA